MLDLRTLPHDADNVICWTSRILACCTSCVICWTSSTLACWTYGVICRTSRIFRLLRLPRDRPDSKVHSGWCACCVIGRISRILLACCASCVIGQTSRNILACCANSEYAEYREYSRLLHNSLICQISRTCVRLLCLLRDRPDIKDIPLLDVACELPDIKQYWPAVLTMCSAEHQGQWSAVRMVRYA